MHSRSIPVIHMSPVAPMQEFRGVEGESGGGEAVQSAWRSGARECRFLPRIRALLSSITSKQDG
jgi:hypothetical protein